MKKHIGLLFFAFFVGALATPVLWTHAADEIDTYCVAPTDAVPHGSTVSLTIKFSDSDKSNDFIVQGPFKILKYKDGMPVIVDFKRGNEKDDKGKENPEKPMLTFNVSLSPKHKLPAPATEAATFTYYVTHKEGKRGSLSTASREQTVECSFTVQHEIEKKTTPSGQGGDIQKNIVPADLGITNTGTLPTSMWYFLKEWRRGFERFFTFNAVKKAELELDILNEKAAEALAVQQTTPDDQKALEGALANYANAQARLKDRITNLKESSDNPEVGRLLQKLDERTLKHAILMNQLAERWNSDPYAEDASRVNPQATRDNHLQDAVDVVQEKMQEIVEAGAEKEKNIKEKAAEQIKNAQETIGKLELKSATSTVSGLGVSNNRAINTKGTGVVARIVCDATDEPTCTKGMANCDLSTGKWHCPYGIGTDAGSTTAGIAIGDPGVNGNRISTNMTVERQTPKRDFGDRMKAGLDAVGGILANAKAHLALAETAFAEGKFGEAFGQARAAEVIAWKGLKLFTDKNGDGTMEKDEMGKLLRPGTDLDVPRIEDKPKSMMPPMPNVPMPEAKGDKPTQSQFKNLIDSSVNIMEDNTKGTGTDEATSTQPTTVESQSGTVAPTVISPSSLVR